MISNTVSPRLPANMEAIKLSDERCVRWFVEALQLLQRFDQTASRETLKSASSLLSKCMESYPNDQLPKFYFGITSMVLDDMDQRAAISVFGEFRESDVFEVRTAATYNLVLAYIETYDYNLFTKAQDIMTQLVRDLLKHGAPIGRGRFGDVLAQILGKRKTHIEQLYYQSMEVSSYLDIHLNAWSDRWYGATDELENKAKGYLSTLDQYRSDIERHSYFLPDERAEIWAWHWNNVGSIQETLAAIALRSDDRRKKEEHLSKAKVAYGNAIKEVPTWDSARANLGRLCLEIAADEDLASEQFHRVLDGAEDQDYAQYNLGLIETLRGDSEKAVEHMKKAPIMLGRRGRSANWVGARKMLAYELTKWRRQADALELLEGLMAEYPDDQQVRDQIEELKKP